MTVNVDVLALVVEGVMLLTVRVVDTDVVIECVVPLVIVGVRCGYCDGCFKFRLF